MPLKCGGKGTPTFVRCVPQVQVGAGTPFAEGLTLMRRFALSGLAVCFVLLGTAPAQAAAASVRQVYAPMWMTDFVKQEPCLMTVAAPAAADENCIPWTRRENAAPTLDEATGRLYLGGSDGKLHSISARDGTHVFRVDLPGFLQSKPTLSQSALYFGTSEGRVLRVAASDGEIGWNVQVDAEVLEPVVVHEETIYAVTGLETIYAIDKNNGEIRWLQKHPLPTGITLRGQAKPLVVKQPKSEGMQTSVYVGHSDGQLSVLDGETGQVLDVLSLAAGEGFLDVDADPILHGGQIIAASHGQGVFAIHAADMRSAWRYDEPGIVRLASGGPQRVIAAGAGKVIGLDSRTGEERWRFTFPKGAPTRPVVKGGRVHIGSDRGALYILDAYSGEPLQYFGSSLGFAAEPELHADGLFVVSVPGTLFALSNAHPGNIAPRALPRRPKLNP